MHSINMHFRRGCAAVSTRIVLTRVSVDKDARIVSGERVAVGLEREYSMCVARNQRKTTYDNYERRMFCFKVTND